MNDLAKKWVAALRGGSYKQARSALRKDDAFCCLGVLCDLKNKDGWNKHHTDTFLMRHVDAVDGGVEYPGFQILDEVGLDEDQVRVLSRRNDSGATFLEIAEDIEGMLAEAK